MELYLIFRALYKKKFWLLLIMVVAMAAAYILAARYDNLYQSVTKIATGFTVTNQLDPNERVGGFYETDLKFNNLIENINSPIVINQVAYRLMIHDLSEAQPFRNPLNSKGEPLLREREKIRYLSKFKAKLRSMEMLDLNKEEDKDLFRILKAYGYSEKMLRETYYVARNGFTDYLTITATTDHPQLSAYIVNTIFEEFARYNNSLNTVQASETVERLDSLLKAKQWAKEQALEAYKQYQHAANLLDVDIEGDAALKQISSLEEKITDEEAKIRRAQLALAEVEAKIAKLEEEKKGGISAASAGNLSVRRLNQTLLMLEQRRKRNPNNQAILDSIVFINTELSRMGVVAGGGMNVAARLEEAYDLRSEYKTQIATSSQTLENLRLRLRTVAGSKSTFAQKGARIKLLQENLDLASKEYEEVLQRYNKVLESKNMMSGIKQVIAGQPAQESQRLKRILITIISGAGALMLAVMVIFLLEFLDNSLRTPTVFSRQTKIQLLAVLPEISQKSYAEEVVAMAPPVVAKEKTAAQVVLTSGLNFGINTKNNDSRVLQLFRENIRLLRHELDTSGKKVILFTSLRKGDGKTMVIRSLTNALVKSGKKVLLLDLNFSNNALTEIYTPKSRIEEMLETGSYLTLEAQGKYIGPIQVIGCSRGDHSPVEVIQLTGLQRFIKYYCQLYDYILIEAADMAQHSDAMELTSIAERIICISASYHTIDRTDRSNIERLRKTNGVFMGGVLNRVNQENMHL
jgi:Mrp family chromosome partitioning ATPase/uncharacterized protein involved in exopolysaccharide biosynthesis